MDGMEIPLETNAGDVAGLLLRIRGLGLDAFAEVVVRRCARLLDLAAAPAGAHDPRWRDLARERATWPALLAALEQTLGRTPPLVQLAVALALEPPEIELIVFLWGLSRSDALARQARDLAAAAGSGVPADADPGVPAGAVVDAAFPDAIARQQAWHALRPQGVLRRRRLVRMAAHAQPRRAAIELDPEIAAFLDGVWHAPAVDAIRGRGLDGPDDEDSEDGRAAPAAAPEPAGIVHKPVLARLQALLAPPAAHIALVGRAGAGKRTLARAAAARLGGPLIEVRLDALPDGRRADVLARCARDALLYQAVLYVELDRARALAWAAAPDAVDAADDAAGDAIDSAADGVIAALAAHPGRLVVGVPAEPGSSVAGRTRAALPAMIEIAVPDVRLAVQPALWGQLLRARLDALVAAGEASSWPASMLTEPTEEALEAHACRHGLIIGDMVRATEAAIVTALARLDAGAPAGDGDGEDRAAAGGDALAAALGAALSEHLARELEPLAERLWPPAAPAAAVAPAAPRDPAWGALAATVRGGRLEVDAWGASTRTSARPYPLVARIAGGTHDRVAAAARFLAHATGMPIYRADLGYFAHLAPAAATDAVDRLFAAAARCGAMLLLTPITALALDQPHARAMANAVGVCLEQADIPVLLHDPDPGAAAALPVAIESRIERALTVDPAA